MWLVKSKEMQTVISRGLISRALRRPMAHSAVSEKKKHTSVSVETVHNICKRHIYLHSVYAYAYIFSTYATELSVKDITLFLL